MGDNIRLAFSSIRANKMRSMLTMLGIIIGIAAVIAIMTIAASMNLAMEAQAAAQGANNLNVEVQPADEDDSSSVVLSVAPPQTNTDGGQYKYSNGLPLDALIPLDTMDQFAQQFAPRLSGLSYDWQIGGGNIELDHQNTGVSIHGVNATYLETSHFMSNISLSQGRWISQEDIDKDRDVVVIRQDIAVEIFGSEEAALGQELDVVVTDPITSLALTVVGTYQTHATTSGNFLVGNYTFDLSQFGNSDIYIPVNLALSVYHATGISGFSLSGIPGVDFQQLQTDIKAFFAANYRCPGYEINVDLPSSGGYGDEETMGTLETAFSIIAAISLIVGGIGVMNIMMVSITERTREIGVRKALGAKRRDIRWQFITESTVLSLMGGIIGIILGMILGNVFARFMGYPATASVASIFISFGVSVAIGIFFGYYPANKAAKLNPIDALRYE